MRHGGLLLELDAELEDPAFQRWLALPDWEPARLSTSLARVGLHLVWRRAG
jgi:hypothetical protein